MDGFSRQTVIVGFVVVAVTSAILGGIIALVLFNSDPEIVVREVLVEASEPVVVPNQEDLARLVERYIDISGTEDDWTFSLVEEIAAAVCDGGLSGAEVMQEIGLDGDIEIGQAQLDAFVGEVRSTCPSHETG